MRPVVRKQMFPILLVCLLDTFSRQINISKIIKQPRELQHLSQTMFFLSQNALDELLTSRVKFFEAHVPLPWPELFSAE